MTWYSSVRGTIASVEESSRNETKQKSMLFQIITFKMACGFQHRYFSPALMTPPIPPAEWKQIIRSVRTWFTQRARGCSATQRQAGDLCKFWSVWRHLLPTSMCNYHQSGAVAAGEYQWDPHGSKDRPTRTNDHVQDANSSSPGSSMESKCWQKKNKKGRVVSDGLAFVRTQVFHLLACISHPSISPSTRPSIHP